MDKRFIIDKDANPNYLATICRIGKFQPIENADRLVKTVVNGYNIIVSKDFKEGEIVVYFPVESCISEKYLSANNLYSRSNFEKNANAEDVKKLIVESENADEVKASEISLKIKDMCGFFEKNNRVRILKLRGEYSVGFIAKVDSLVKYNPALSDINWDKMVGTQFSHIGDDEICTKFIPKIKECHSGGGDKSLWKKRMKKLNRFDKVNPKYFQFHYDTKMLAEHIKEIQPDDWVTISVKVHGTSAILANVLCNRKLSIWDKIKKFFGVNVPMFEYGNLYSSRSVIKNQYINPSSNSFYDGNIWECVNRDFKDFIPNGMTVYGEIAGYLEGSQTMIQKNHDYGCKVGEWKFMPYRIKTVDKDGNEYEWNVTEVYEWTMKLIHDHPEIEKKVLPINIVYDGKMKDLYPDITIDENWSSNALERMKNDKDRFLMELDEPMCKNKVPREGIVIRIKNDAFARAWKLKTLRHYGKEAEQHDKREVDIEEMA